MKQSRSQLLSLARKNKKDEFYTQYKDIEKEMVFYIEYFKDKVIYCNCDDYRMSQFVKFFIDHFEEYGIKKLISTHYSEHCSLFEDSLPAYKFEKTKDNEIITELNEDGDFRSKECIELLKESDVIITNPPFSLFRELIVLLFEYNKDFIILGNLNTLTAKDIFHFFQENRMWFGVTIHSSSREFQVPDDYPLEADSCREVEGKRYIRVKGVRWYTNIHSDNRILGFELVKKYDDTYKKYDDYDAIEIGNLKDIPYDYDGLMGVPITFLDKYDPNQFEIVGIEREYVDKEILTDGRFTIDGKTLYARILIRKK